MMSLDERPLNFDEIAHVKPAGLDFILPSNLEAGEPPEARGLSRDAVRLLVSYQSDNSMVHTHFSHLGHYLRPGDVVVINTSGTMNAAIAATRADGTALELHLSTHLPGGLWIVEVRSYNANATKPFFNIQAGETLHLAGGATATLHTTYRSENDERQAEQQRLWLATLNTPSPLQEYLQRFGFPIRYHYVKEQWPIEYYQTVYVTEIGSAEMPSAGRAFTPELIMQLVARGIQIAPLLLHTGVASLESHEPPYEEFYRVPSETASLVNAAKVKGRRVIAVGTTVVRALETVTDSDGVTHAGEGWTRLVVTPQRGIQAVNGLLTGLHEPQASHLFMLEALSNPEHLRLAYTEAIKEGYLWHEFGDLHLLLP